MLLQPVPKAEFQISQNYGAPEESLGRWAQFYKTEKLYIW